MDTSLLCPTSSSVKSNMDSYFHPCSVCLRHVPEIHYAKDKITRHLTLYKAGSPWRLWGVRDGYWQLLLQLVLEVSDLFIPDIRYAQSLTSPYLLGKTKWLLKCVKLYLCT